MPYYFQLYTVLQSYTVIICFIGLFGNVNLIIATCRQRALRTKMGCLLMISTISHTVCLISELISVALKLRFTQLPRDECFHFVAVYMFALLFQSTLFLMMAVDLLLAVLMPIRHKFWHRGPYILALCIPPITFSVFAVVIENIYVTHDYLLFCTVSLAVPNKVRFWGTLITFCTVCLAVILISITALKVHLNEKSATPFLRNLSIHTKPRCSEVKLLKSLATLIFVFICSWSLSLVLFHVSLYFDASVTYQVHKYTFVLQLPTFCQNFFVTALRSPRYRRAYLEQLSCLPCLAALGNYKLNSNTTTLKKSLHHVIVEVRHAHSLPPKFV